MDLFPIKFQASGRMGAATIIGLSLAAMALNLLLIAVTAGAAAAGAAVGWELVT